ncbi:unnamed protein product [Arabis nemorensis]|uniref:Mediator complex subunit 15 KIX domain-containing protein n=1 Tax=Arabis nemorensis TaxID=586526 RepID=A0A565AR13_9BRAS|nr:unnamed protein product [Arabis nemorensis]
MDTCDWRTQFPSDSRSNIINKILETLKRHLPFSGPEGLNELRRIATRFEDKIYTTAVNQTDYLRKISVKMLTMETKSQASAGYSTFLPAANYATPLYQSGYHMVNDNSRTSLPKREPDLNIDDWRTQLPPDSRQKNVNKIRDSLNKHVPISGQEGINELLRIAASFEELIFNAARNKMDYFRKVSFKMQTMEEGD